MEGALAGRAAVRLPVGGRVVSEGRTGRRAGRRPNRDRRQRAGPQVAAGDGERYRESIESWSDVFHDLIRRGLCETQLVIGHGALGLWVPVRDVLPAARHQHCSCHKMLNVLDPGASSPKGKPCCGTSATRIEPTGSRVSARGE